MTPALYACLERCQLAGTTPGECRYCGRRTTPVMDVGFVEDERRCGNHWRYLPDGARVCRCGHVEARDNASE